MFRTRRSRLILVIAIAAFLFEAFYLCIGLQWWTLPLLTVAAVSIAGATFLIARWIENGATNGCG